MNEFSDLQIVLMILSGVLVGGFIVWSRRDKPSVFPEWANWRVKGGSKGSGDTKPRQK